jgi:HTH-type transcriptional regulator/antitoxin HipB
MSQLARSPSQLGAILHRQRTLKGMTQKQLASGLGMRQATISRLEGGFAGTKLSTLLDVLAALDLELAIEPRSKGTAQDIEDIF